MSPTPDDTAPILPPATIGIIGGGQLGRMLAIAARGDALREDQPWLTH